MKKIRLTFTNGLTKYVAEIHPEECEDPDSIPFYGLADNFGDGAAFKNEEQALKFATSHFVLHEIAYANPPLRSLELVESEADDLINPPFKPLYPYERFCEFVEKNKRTAQEIEQALGKARKELAEIPKLPLTDTGKRNEIKTRATFITHSERWLREHGENNEQNQQ